MKLNIKNNKTNICRINAEIRQEIRRTKGPWNWPRKIFSPNFKAMPSKRLRRSGLCDGHEEVVGNFRPIAKLSMKRGCASRNLLPCFSAWTRKGNPPGGKIIDTDSPSPNMFFPRYRRIRPTHY